MSVNCSNNRILICLCSRSHVGSVFLWGSFISYMLLVPVFLSVLYLGYRKWKKPSSVSHSDVFTFHLVCMDSLAALGSIFFTWGLQAKISPVFTVGLSLWEMSFNGQLYFHSLTCVDRYLAVVRPITYLRLKKSVWTIVRNIGVGFIWGLCICHPLVSSSSEHLENLIYFAQVILSLALMSFCSVSVLCVLIRPGPGEGGGTRKQLKQSKKSAFYTIIVILAVMVLRHGISVVYQILFWFNKDFTHCSMLTSMLWFSLPSSLVLPVLFLHRERTTRR
ncbi:hypothetical protein NQD34_013439 [Periophthalmus magnuspinnatus]|nr:hypothetical protein NQD34_013439 [Periophthalmus magnuspinnatus]